MIVLGDRSFIYAVVFFWFSIATQVVVNAQFESNQLDQRRRGRIFCTNNQYVLLSILMNSFS